MNSDNTQLCIQIPSSDTLWSQRMHKLLSSQREIAEDIPLLLKLIHSNGIYIKVNQIPFCYNSFDSLSSHILILKGQSKFRIASPI